MPHTLPTRVFVRHFLLHTARNLATWLRFCLVVAVWLGCLPFAIRQVWRLLFWFSDGGWPTQHLEKIGTAGNSTVIDEMGRHLQASLAANGTSPAMPWLAAQTTPASLGVAMDGFLKFLEPVSHALNISAVDPLAAGFFKMIYYGLGMHSATPSMRSQTTNETIDRFMMRVSPAARSLSLLSEISFLKNLTRYTYVNELVISIAEGYIITILVVVCFILIFLIREWVVQQQPNINMGAGFNAEFAAADRPRDERDDFVPQDVNINPVPRPLAIPRRANRPRNLPMDNQEFLHDVAQAPNRPAPVRDALTPAAEIQRQLAEEPGMTEEFMTIWRRAESNPEEVLRIIERENKGDELSYWVNAMKRLPAHMPHDTEHDGSSSSATLLPNSFGRSGGRSLISQIGSDRATPSGESWMDIPLPIENPEIDDLRRAVQMQTGNNADLEHNLDKGKGKAREQPLESALDHDGQLQLGMTLASREPGTAINRNGEATTSSVYSTPNKPRSRAVSDGPQPRDISPLANGNWSFKSLANDQENLHPQAATANDYGKFSVAQSPAGALNQTQRSQSWKDAQDLRVQQAIIKGREASNAEPSSDAGPQQVQPGSPTELIRRDGTRRRYPNLEEMFADNPVPQSDSEEEQEDPNVRHNPAETNPFAPDTPLPLPRDPIFQRHAEPQGVLGNFADWLWVGVEEDRRQDEGGNDEHIVEDLAAEAPFVPIAHNDPFGQLGDMAEPDPEVVEAARAAGIDPNDPDAIEDAEDFEGIMELIGMRGPIFSLVQNALFSAFLLALTVVFGVWIPYNIGRVSLLLMANPGPAFKLPLRLLFWFAAFLQDVAAVVIGVVSSIMITIVSYVWERANLGTSTLAGAKWASWAYQLARGALDRILEGVLGSLVSFSDSDIFTFSAASHEALLTLQYLITDNLEAIGHGVVFLCIGDYKITTGGAWSLLMRMLNADWHFVSKLPAYLARPDSWVISLEVAKRATPLDLELSVWGGWDRFLATLAGYTTLSLLGVAYVKKGSPFSIGQAGREWEATIIDLLNQAGGVMKVILIISIEMLVFPLYCGLLLDVALLPLFENATLVSRILFTFKSPMTSIFVHWFVGTCYMFHFALFVSMCRKIMRKGVLCKLCPVSHKSPLTLPDFIRDPDDPTFHPVRDVLERNVATQLRKILFSALVYGALVIICLGGVVWGLALTFKGVLPIHWSSNEPVLEFPIDLLFYNFLMPLAVKFFKPSDGLHAMYAWWFRQCARMLRLTWFMFDERKEDEEGYTVRRSWKDVFSGFTGERLPVLIADDPNLPFIQNSKLNAYIRQDGRYVRAPASDQVRVKKGAPIFLNVDEFNNRLPGQPNRPEGDADWDSDMYKQVYIPPHFRMRIFAFIISIWLFAALTGVCITVVPLVFGRHVFSRIIPTNVRKNDVYAFSIGIYILGSALYVILHVREFITYISTSFVFTAETPANIFRRASYIGSRAARIIWTYSAVLFLLPTLFAFLVEFYAILPLHTYLSPKEPHTIHFVQSWTLGLLYVKLTTRLIQFYPESRFATSLRLIVRNGYLRPDAWLATRSFILPAALLLSTALVVPWCLAQIAVILALQNISEHNKMLVFRFAYPAVLAFAGWVYVLHLVSRAVAGWKMRIKDEVYLIGERLHNFGERKVVSPNVTTAGQMAVRRIDT